MEPKTKEELAVEYERSLDAFADDYDGRDIQAAFLAGWEACEKCHAENWLEVEAAIKRSFDDLQKQLGR